MNRFHWWHSLAFARKRSSMNSPGKDPTSIHKEPEAMETSETILIAQVSATFTTTTAEPNNLSEDEEEEDEDEELVTMEDMMQEHERQEETARILLGGQDEKVCTFPEGYKPRQALYSCLTCTPAPNVRGICYGCSVNCHDGHTMVELYTKRRFRCDCGNDGFNGKKCELYEDKPSCNPRNTYNQNFEGFFCSKKCVYPDPNNSEDMIQCTFCEDWFHLTHCGLDPLEDSSTCDLVCGECVVKAPWITSFKTDAEKVCISSVSPDMSSSAILLSPTEGWRKKICGCVNCLNLLDRLSLDFLTEPEDLVSAYEAESKEKTKDENTPTDNMDVAYMLAKKEGPEAAIHMMKGYNYLKQQLSTFLREMADKGEVIKKEDVNGFFDQIKRRKLE